MYPDSVVYMLQLQYMQEYTAERKQLKERIDHIAEFLKEQEEKREVKRIKDILIYKIYLFLELTRCTNGIIVLFTIRKL